MRERAVRMVFYHAGVFAPTAARLAQGFPFDEVGPVIEDPATLPRAAPQVAADRIEGRIVRVDRFGNLLTNIDEATLVGTFGRGEGLHISCGRWPLTMTTTYGDLAPGEAGALLGSAGYLELFLRNGRGALELGLAVGDTVVVRPNTTTADK
ncbi:MAG: SAM-dependent chlorinase/fluorinase [Nitrospinae bacterium]|nr:SAM-dependent chlorinase/fluorinase [Nitrospinota bacterium]